MPRLLKYLLAVFIGLVSALILSSLIQVGVYLAAPDLRTDSSVRQERSVQ